MRLVATSDWHGDLPDFVPDGDVLVLAGDLLSMNHALEAQRAHFRSRLVPYLAELPHERVLLVAGNHDFLFANGRAWRDELPPNVTYLLDESVEIGGLRFWGTPWSVYLPRWVFMEPESALARIWSGIDADTDVLVVHGPPYGALDRTVPAFGDSNVGSPSLREWIEDHQPRLVVCGHIHEAFGVDRIGSTAVHNVSFLDENYRHSPGRDPVVIDLG